jgi:hypothetical protein
MSQLALCECGGLAEPINGRPVCCACGRTVAAPAERPTPAAEQERLFTAPMTIPGQMELP